MNEELSLLSGQRVLVTILIMTLVTFSTRAFPFVLFGRSDKTPPKLVLYLGKYLPPALICSIIVYCFRDLQFTAPPWGLPEVICALLVVGLHLWRGNTMLSIFAGTGLYMLLVQYVF